MTNARSEEPRPCNCCDSTQFAVGYLTNQPRGLVLCRGRAQSESEEESSQGSEEQEQGSGDEGDSEDTADTGEEPQGARGKGGKSRVDKDQDSGSADEGGGSSADEGSEGGEEEEEDDDVSEEEPQVTSIVWIWWDVEANSLLCVALVGCRDLYDMIVVGL